MKHLSELAYSHRMIFWFCIILIVIGGIYSFFTISKLEDPEIVVMQAMVVTVYPGATAEEVELQVSNVLENEIRSMDGIDKISTTSMANVSQVNVLLKFTVPDDEITQKWDILRRKVQAARSKLPSKIQEPIVMDDIGDVYGIFYSMTGEGFDYEELNRYATFIKRDLLTLSGVKRVEIFGNQPSNIDIELSPEEAASLGIFPAQIIAAIADHTNPVYAGNYLVGGEQITLDVEGRFHSLDDIRQLRIKGFQNDMIRLGDLCHIEKSVAEPPRFTLLYDGAPALGIFVAMEQNENVIDVGKAVETRMDALTHQIPMGINFSKVFFQPEKVSDAINNFMWNLVLSVVVVILVLMFTMGYRSGLIIGIGLFLTILASFPILQALGGTLQRISLGAFVVAMGMLVDNAIVVMDGITVDLQRQLPIKTALFQTAKKTAIPLLGATTIAIVAFLPVYLSPDTAGVYIGDLFIVLCISLGLSWVLAITQVPIFSLYFLNFRKYRKKRDKPFSNRFYQSIRKCLHVVMRHKLVTISIAVILLLVCMIGFKYTKKTFFPDFDYNQAYVEFTMPANTSVERINELMKQISDDLMQMDGIVHVTASQGMTPGRYCLVRSFNQIGDNYAEFIIDFKNYKSMRQMRQAVERYLFINYPEAYSRFRLYNLSILSSHTIEVEFTGPDINVLRNLERQAEGVMRCNPLINQQTICSDMDGPGKLFVAKYEEAVGCKLGIDRSDVSYALLAATDGLPIGTYWENERSYPILLKIRDKDGGRITELNNLPVWGLLPNANALNANVVQELATGTKESSEVMKEVVKPTPLNQVASEIPMEWEESVIHRTDGRRSIQAQCEPVDNSNPSDVRNRMKRAIDQIKLPEGYAVSWSGEYELREKALKNIIDLLPMAAFFILLILILLFNDWRKTLIIVLCLPFAAIGIVPGLLLFNQPFSFVAIVGTIGMAGMMIKNGIVLIEEIGFRLEGGAVAYTALIEATISRIRPVMMASLTTILGMIPLLRDPMYGALATTIMCGLLVGTIITLILLPTFYALFFKIRKPQKQ